MNNPRESDGAAEILEALVPVVRSRTLSLDDAWAVVAAVAPTLEAQAKVEVLREVSGQIDEELGSEEGYMPWCSRLGLHANHECIFGEGGLSIPDWLRDLAANIEAKAGDRG